jgi:hypothetical protein
MTNSKDRDSRKKAKHRCKCGRKAVYRRPRGGLSARKDHPLCRQCFQSECDRERARKLAANDNEPHEDLVAWKAPG